MNRRPEKKNPVKAPLRPPGSSTRRYAIIARHDNLIDRIEERRRRGYFPSCHDPDPPPRLADSDDNLAAAIAVGVGLLLDRFDRLLAMLDEARS